MFHTFCRFVRFHLTLVAVQIIVEGSEVDKDHLAMYPYCGLGSDPSKNFKAKVRTKQDDLKATGIFDLIYEAIPISLPTNAK